ncbi:uncharacterized protein LOC110845683 [Folsomia candida]|uniref:uncharacterized protein LOC110845683 n=1 Tax=Folsomia candida TaxID=158441 RepID=UPI000B902F13|nr:uncharacterized protein LOC110845683 [Folsomia candida]
MNSKRGLSSRVAIARAFLIVSFLSTQFVQVLNSPVPKAADLSLTILQDGNTTAPPKSDDDDGLSTMTWVWIGLGIVVALIFLSCLLSYLFCAVISEILCLPFTCLKKIICCCCD